MPPRRRDADGLFTEQRRFLGAVAELGDVDKAIEKAKITPRRFKGWLWTDPAFQLAYDEVAGPSLDTAKEMLHSQSLRAAAVHSEAMEAEKGVAAEVACPKCNTKFAVYSIRPDHQIRIKAGETVLKVGGILIDQRHIRKDIVNWDFELVQFLIAHKAGMKVPAQALEKLKTAGMLPEGGKQDARTDT